MSVEDETQRTFILGPCKDDEEKISKCQWTGDFWLVNTEKVLKKCETRSYLYTTNLQSYRN